MEEEPLTRLPTRFEALSLVLLPVKSLVLYEEKEEGRREDGSELERVRRGREGEKNNATTHFGSSSEQRRTEERDKEI